MCAAEVIKDFGHNLSFKDVDGMPNISIRNFSNLHLADNEDFASTLDKDEQLEDACGAGTNLQWWLDDMELIARGVVDADVVLRISAVLS
ncbi:hypothetical protein FZEAL_3331 [Fusarium zealandicum]|uniref:Uncharacterized protein n=1 Tax=Fusarium zealandicum TaxID=1053134 RepID=A0A8H4XMJ3_9HYPO|nr:hypothetical protein FZEAL_3331 [Fusarium zealandicum]